MKGALFLLTGMLLAFYGSVDETELHGRVVHHRVLGGLFVVAALACSAPASRSVWCCCPHCPPWPLCWWRCQHLTGTVVLVG